MIAKRIFYCWFGNGEMSNLNKRCIESWKKYCPDYEIILINELNYDWNSNPYAKIGYEAGNWSAVSNAARLEFLKQYSGFYLDTDVELCKSLDELRKYDGGFITEFVSSQPDSGILGRGSEFPSFYEEVYKNLQPGCVLHKEFIKELHRRYDIHGEGVRTYDDGFTVLGEEYFPTIRTGLFTEKTIGVHFFENTWVKTQLPITDGFYPYAKVKVQIQNKLVHEDEGADIILKPKNLRKKWNDSDVLGKMNYFFNPKVVKLFCGDFEAERMEYDLTATLHNTVTASGLIVTWME